MLSTPRFLWPLRVYYEDTDAGGVVYYANYLKFMERARSEWLRSLGFEQDVLAQEQGLLFVVRSVEVDYLRPARFNDALTVSAEIAHCGRASLSFAQDICRDDVVLCRGKVKIASVDAQRFRPRQVPEAMMDKLAGRA
jgi:acyl-CoA thioester hydrolase